MSDKTISATDSNIGTQHGYFRFPAAYAASQALAAQGLSVKRSHLSEVIAALLGYRS